MNPFQNIQEELFIYQLENYQNLRFLKWIINHRKHNLEQKRSIVWTSKAKIIYLLTVLSIIILTLLSLIFFNVFLSLLVLLVLLLYPFILLIPIRSTLGIYEFIRRKKDIKELSEKIDSYKGLVSIGITGSAGKTSVKNILKLFLGKSVLITPLSYNTFYGIKKVIDYELDGNVKYFVCEMGAYKVGEIEELCKIVKPAVSILTTINKQHIERFGTLKNTIRAKFEILDGTRPGGKGVVNLDNKYIRENLRDVKKDIELIGFTADNNFNENCQTVIKAENYSINNGIANFELITDKKRYEISTALLGKHHLRNILAAVSAVIALGQDPTAAIEAVSSLPQVQHRLEYDQKNGINILDDSYSSNEEGFIEALAVLKSFKGKKILVTPGIVELGNYYYEVYKKLIPYIKNSSDIRIIVGTQESSRKLFEMVRKFKNVYSAKTNQEAQNILKNIIKPGDTVLFENDLPDQYL